MKLNSIVELFSIDFENTNPLAFVETFSFEIEFLFRRLIRLYLHSV